MEICLVTHKSVTTRCKIYLFSVSREAHTPLVQVPPSSEVTKDVAEIINVDGTLESLYVIGRKIILELEFLGMKYFEREAVGECCRETCRL